MSNGNWEKRITMLEVQNEHICQEVKEVKGAVETIRDNHLVHLRRQIEDLRLEMVERTTELSNDLAEKMAKMNTNLSRKDASLDKDLAGLTTKIAIIVAVITEVVMIAARYFVSSFL